jgi:hypothetical protein
MSENNTPTPSDNGDAKAKSQVASPVASSTLRWTARDQYAAAAMQALIPTFRADQRAARVDQIAKEAYDIADAMLKNG